MRTAAAILLVLVCCAITAAQPKDAATDVVADVTVEPFPDAAVNLMPFGDFEQPNEAGDGPVGWQNVDNLVYHWTSSPERGRHILIDTDVNQRQAYAWWIKRYIHGAPLSEAPRKEPTQPPQYDTIAGLDGGFFWSDFIPVKPGGAYKVYVDAKGPKAKVFIRGYEKRVPLSFADEAPAVQQVFRRARGEPETDKNGRPIRYRLRYSYQTWFAVGGSDQWQTCTHIQPRHPNNRELTENVRWIRIALYPYWPPGEYCFDNIRVVEVTDPDPRQGVPQAEQADFEEGKVIR